MNSPLAPALPPLSRFALLLEAAFPFVAPQAYIWSVPRSRPRSVDVAFGVFVGAIVLVYVLRRRWRTPRDFGVARGPEHLAAAAPVALFTLLAAIGLLAIGVATTGRPQGGLRYTPELFGALAAYPLWGVVQQGVLFGVAYPRLRAAFGERWAPVGAAVLFGVAHLPNPLLSIGGAGMAYFFAHVWRRAPSLPVIAMSHGMIGAVCDKALHVSMRVGANYLG